MLALILKYSCANVQPQREFIANAPQYKSNVTVVILKIHEDKSVCIELMLKLLGAMRSCTSLTTAAQTRSIIRSHRTRLIVFTCN